MSSRLLVSYGASPDVICLIVDFVEQDGFGLVTGITSLFGISNFSSPRRRRTANGSMVEEADLFASAVTMVSYQLISLFYSFVIVVLLVCSNGRSLYASEWLTFQASHIVLARDDLNFPPPSLRLSKQLTALKTSCMVLSLTKGVDRNVWGKGAKPHLPQLYSRFLPPYWTASAASAVVVGVRLSSTARPPVPVYRAIRVAHGNMFVLWKGTIESVATARYELLGAWSIFSILDL
ncbi:hypothetical protein EDD85DRAFT_961936 [Armillaria nabsnona]|nr:hypothetical protein EDD85DRAFT_961936 [Armillaria nabsnona]